MTEAHEAQETSGDADIHDANNHLKGTEFDSFAIGEDSPIRRGVITIDKARLRFAVYPKKISMRGRLYYPVRLNYMPDCGYVLKAVPIDKDQGCRDDLW